MGAPGDSPESAASSCYSHTACSDDHLKVVFHQTHHVEAGVSAPRQSGITVLYVGLHISDSSGAVRNSRLRHPRFLSGSALDSLLRTVPGWLDSGSLHLRADAGGQSFSTPWPRWYLDSTFAYSSEFEWQQNSVMCTGAT